MATIYIDDSPYEVATGQSLLQAALSAGLNIEYFCWHPALGSVGACRQCAVKQFRDEDDTEGRIVMSCMLPVEDGLRVSIRDGEASAFRAAVIEWLMANHPHDCPVCDEGGECHLQDMTVMSGHVYRRHRFEKRTHHNQYLGPFIHHEMNRCIECYRCVRYYRHYADGRDLDVFGAHDHVYFGRHEDGVLENEFSGNLVEICPTGVFTDKTLREHYTRKWDMTSAPSVCAHCGLGCNTIPSARYGEVRRILNRYNREVNGYFLCDRGRFGYGFTNAPTRIREARAHRAAGGGHDALDSSEALERAVSLLDGAKGVIGIGSPRASLESNFSLRRLVGRERFHSGLSPLEEQLVSAIDDILRNGAVRTPPLCEVEKADAVLVIGEDVTATAPRLALALRQASRQEPLKAVEATQIPLWQDAPVRDFLQDRRGPFFLATIARTRLEDVGTEVRHAEPDGIARLGFAVAHAVDPAFPDVPGLDEETRGFAERIARALANADRPLVVSGTGAGSLAVVHAAANVARALAKTRGDRDGRGGLCYAVPEANTLGLAALGGRPLDEALEAARRGEVDVAIILENDLVRRVSRMEAEAFFGALRQVIVLDHVETETTERATLVLPAATFAEGSGTFLSSEGRAQRFFRVLEPNGHARDAWKWLGELAARRERDDADGAQSLDDLDDIVRALGHEVPGLRGVEEAAPPADFRIAGRKIPREAPRYSGRTSIHAAESVHEPPPSGDADSALAFSMEGYIGHNVPPALLARYWSPGWNSVQALNKFQQEVGGPLREGSPGRRLIEPRADGANDPVGEPPEPFEPRDGQWLVLALHHIFGSEELSARSRVIAERAPESYIAIHSKDAVEIGLSDGDPAEVAVCGSTHRAPVALRDDLPRGTIGIPAGLPGFTGVQLPRWGSIEKVENADTVEGGGTVESGGKLVESGGEA